MQLLFIITLNYFIKYCIALQHYVITFHYCKVLINVIISVTMMMWVNI